MRFTFLLALGLFFAFENLHSQEASVDLHVDSILYSKYEASVVFLNSFKVDKAEVILDSILDEIQETKILDTPFGLRVQQRKAEALERDGEGDLALLALQNIKSKALLSEVWDAYARASINLGLLYEKIGKDKDCIQNLRDAQKTLESNPSLSHIYPFFCVRISSYHRLFDSQDSARYYAQECLRTYKAHNEYAQGGDGYMLMTILSSTDSDRLKNAKAAVKIFSKLENYNALGYMIANIANIHLRRGEYKKALTYNDSTIIAAKKSLAGGYDVYHSLYTAYKFRGEIYNQYGKNDSSIYYIKKGYELQNQHILKENNNKVIAMDIKYKDDKKALKIKEQEEQLKSASIQKTLLMLIFGMVILFTSGLIFYYRRLSKANKQMEVQANQIKKTNKKLSLSLEKQIVLQGEVHHRVKNNLQVIISLLDLQKRELKNEDAIKNADSMSKRIYSMAEIHNLLYQKEDMEFIKLHEYVESLCYHFSNFSIKDEKPIFKLNIESINLNLETSMPIGIILTELLTNSIKYARIPGQKLEIIIDIKHSNNGILLNYKDNGPGFDRDSKNESSGLGFYILESMTRQLQGKLERKNENGASYEIFLTEKNKWTEEDFLSEVE